MNYKNLFKVKLLRLKSTFCIPSLKVIDNFLPPRQVWNFEKKLPRALTLFQRMPCSLSCESPDFIELSTELGLRGLRPPGKRVWHSLKLLDIVQNIWGFSENSSPPWCPKLVTQLGNTKFICERYGLYNETTQPRSGQQTTVRVLYACCMRVACVLYACCMRVACGPQNFYCVGPTHQWWPTSWSRSTGRSSSVSWSIAPDLHWTDKIPIRNTFQSTFEKVHKNYPPISWSRIFLVLLAMADLRLARQCRSLEGVVICFPIIA